MNRRWVRATHSRTDGRFGDCLRTTLATKFYVPPARLNLVLRPRLTDRLDAGLHAKLIRISAPPGFAKTTVLSDWCQHGDRRVAWLSLDEADNDPGRFWRYLISALQTIDS